MGCCFSEESRVDPRELQDLNEREDGSKIEKNRELTDIFSLGFLAVFLLVFSGLVIFVAINADIYRFVNGYDDCGNVCGRTNKVIKDISCSGKDLTNEKYLLVKNESGVVTKQCLKSCPNQYEVIFNRCIKKDKHSKEDFMSGFQEVVKGLNVYWLEILGLCFLAMVWSAIMGVLFRYATKCVVWSMLIGGALAFIAVTIFTWVMYVNTDPKSDEKTAFLIGAVTATIMTVVLLLVILVMRKRIELVIQLIKEAAKAIADLPAVLFEPVLTFIAVTIGGMLWIYFLIISMTSGKLTAVGKIYDYQDNGVVTVTMGLSIFVAWWMYYFMVDCQHMIIAGSIAKWFFTRNKNNLGSPVLKSAYNTVRFHLGTIALGSLIVTVFMIIKTTIKAALKQMSRENGFAIFIKCCVDWCLETLEDLLKYFTRNAYIVTAIYGYSFCKAGKRAFTVLTNNIYSVVVINSVGDFVLGLAKVVIVIITCAIAYAAIKPKEGIDVPFVPIIAVALFTIAISHMFITVYEMTIDTIFICFCEDFEENDGLSKPYYMSRELMDFVKKGHAYLDKSQQDQPAVENV